MTVRDCDVSRRSEMAVAETDGLIKMLTCAECDVDDDQHQADAPDDAESITGCRTNKRSRLVETGDDTLSERRRVTFDLPPEPDDAEDVERVQVQAPPNAAPARPREAGLLRTHEAIFKVPGVTCLGCLLGHGTLKPVVAALRRNAALLEERALLTAAHAAYEDIRTKCRLEGGLLAPEWSLEGIRLHFWEHAFDPVLEAVRLARRLDEVQGVLLEELGRCSGGTGSGGGEGGGTVPTSTLSLLQRLSTAQAKQHAWEQKLLAACESDQQQQQDRHHVTVAAPPTWAKRDGGRGVRRSSAGLLPQARIVPTPSTVAAAIPPPPRAPPALASSPHPPPSRVLPAVASVVSPARPSLVSAPTVNAVPPSATPPTTEPPPLAVPLPAAPPAVLPPSAARPGPACFLDEPEGTSIDDRVRAAASTSPDPGPVQMAKMDAPVAKSVLRDFLSTFVRPCVPPSDAKPAKVQRTLAETWQSANASDVLVRSRRGEACPPRTQRGASIFSHSPPPSPRVAMQMACEPSNASAAATARCARAAAMAATSTSTARSRSSSSTITRRLPSFTFSVA